MKTAEIKNFIKDGLTDEKIKEIFFVGTQQKRLIRVWEKIIENFPEIKEYLDNRYVDGSNYNEILIRINLHVENIEKCPVCGKNKRIFNTLYKNGTHYLETCGDENCFRIIAQKHGEQTKLERYGDPHYANPEKQIQNYNKLSEEEKKEKQHQRELKMLEHYGVRNPFQLESVKEKIKKTNMERYGVEYVQQSDFIKQKFKTTCINKYGVDNPAKTKQAKDKMKNTCMERYGVEYSFQSENNKEKSKQTWIEKYCVDNPLKSDIIKEKAKQTNLEKYGVEYTSQNIEIRKKQLETFNKKYGGNAPICDPTIKEKILSKIPESREKEYQTRKKNGSFNTSKPEKELLEYIKLYFPDVEYQYKNKKEYPFRCDFYIPELNLYIEYNGLWTHGGHPFDENNQEDIDKLNLWKSKNTKYYQNAINTWTNLDVRKRTTAKNNNLNYKEFWNLNEAKQFIYSLIK